MIEPRFSHQKVLVVGGNVGIGFAVAQMAVARGAEVVIAARDADKLAPAIVRLAPGVRAIAVDTTDEASGQSLFELQGAV